MLARASLFASLLLPLVACGTTEDDDYFWGDDDDGFHADGKADSGNKLDYQSYEVMFTNPLCREYTYENPVETADGSATLTTKPKNVYCGRGDIAPSAARSSSPQFRLLEWIKPLGAGDEIFLAYLSFSNNDVSNALCEASQRGTKITFVLDAASTQSESLKACGATILLRGHQGSIGYAHNKLILINPHGDSDYMKMTISSGNMSSGVVTHHENWHFIEAARESYFAQSHLCLMDANVVPEATAGKAQYRTALNNCRKLITAPEEDDIKAFYSPNRDDSKRAERYMLGAIDDAAIIDLGAHRFGHTGLISKLETRLEANDLELRMIADDDMYWLDPEVGTGAEVGANLFFEGANVRRLEEAGGDNFEIRYMETNNGEHLLHHKKYLLYRTANGEPFGLLAGAMNLTNSGFNDNLENIYFIKIPSVMAAFDTQHEREWNGVKGDPSEQDPPIATPRNLMPAVNVPGK